MGTFRVRDPQLPPARRARIIQEAVEDRATAYFVGDGLQRVLADIGDPTRQLQFLAELQSAGTTLKAVQIISRQDSDNKGCSPSPASTALPRSRLLR